MQIHCTPGADLCITSKRMKMQKLKNLPRRLEEIAISQIIFDHSEWVSLWGYMTRRGDQNRMDFILNFDTLNRLLRFSGKTGDKIQMLLVEKIEKGLEEPSVIDLEEVFGKPQVLNQCRIEVSLTGIENKEGRWVEDPNCLSIDEVLPLLEKKGPGLSQQSISKQNFTQCLEILTCSYELYLGYQEIGMDEEMALKKAELEDDLKFKMAYYAWRMNQNTAGE